MSICKHVFTAGKAPAGLLIALFVLAAGALPARAQDNNGNQPSQREILTHYSLYYENFKNENWKAARPDLLWMLEHAPAAPQNDDRNFERVVELYAGLAEQAESEAKTQAYLDTAWTHLNQAPQRLEKLGADYSEFAWTMEKGRFLQQYGDQLPGVDQQAVAYYRKAFEMAPDQMAPYYIDRIIQHYVQNDQQQEALAFMNQVEAQRSGDPKVMAVLQPYREQIFGRNPQAQITYLEGQLKEQPNDPKIMAQLFNLYLQQGQRDKANALTQQLLKSNPTLEVYRQIAQMRLEDGQAQRAFELYQQAEQDSQTKPLTAEDYYRMGEAQMQMGNLAKARTYYRKALEQNPDYGQAYLAIGDLYARAVSECGGSKMARDDKAVYWLAVDMYQKAKQVDPSVASTANTKIQTYRKYFPTAEDIFYRDDWEPGQSFRIDYGCYSWIDETTTVRQASS